MPNQQLTMERLMILSLFFYRMNHGLVSTRPLDMWVNGKK